ncbi:MAG: ABC transporter substrate-binding protein [Chitinophagaceae bacterium]
MFSCKDQLSRSIEFKHLPKRIISLVPSQTELLHDLGLNEEVIGITKFCVHPKNWFRNKTKIGGTKNINIEKIKSLKPDLIIANKEENVKEQIEELEKFVPVWISDVNNFEDALNMIKFVGELTAKTEEAHKLITQIENEFHELNFFLSTVNSQLSVVYLIWKNPYIAAAGDTFIGEMLRRCRFQNVFENKKRYPQIELNSLLSANYQLILLSSEPYPFKEKHIDEIKKELPDSKVILVDGEMFSWYGSRMLRAADYFKTLIAQISYTN